MNFTPSTTSQATKNVAILSQNLENRVNWRKLESSVETAAYPLFTKGTWGHEKRVSSMSCVCAPLRDMVEILGYAGGQSYAALSES